MLVWLLWVSVCYWLIPLSFLILPVILLQHQLLWPCRSLMSAPLHSALRVWGSLLPLRTSWVIVWDLPAVIVWDLPAVSIFITHFPFVPLHLPIKVQSKEERGIFHHPLNSLSPLVYGLIVYYGTGMNGWRVVWWRYVEGSGGEGGGGVEGVCNHLIQTYTGGISLLILTIPF